MLLAPPNRGSALARAIKELRLLGPIIDLFWGPSGACWRSMQAFHRIVAC